MVETFPATVNGTVRENCEPVASEEELRYHCANRPLTSMLTSVVCRFAPAEGVKWNVAVLISSVVDVPTTIICSPPAAEVTDTLRITGAVPAILVVNTGAGAGVIFTPAALKARDSWMVP